MKSQVNTLTVTEKPFPKLMTTKDGLVILATGFNQKNLSCICGTVIHGLDGRHYFSDFWNKNLFKDFNGTVTLSND